MTLLKQADREDWQIPQQLTAWVAQYQYANILDWLEQEYYSDRNNT